jgi:hypothetical protein
MPVQIQFKLGETFSGPFLAPQWRTDNYEPALADWRYICLNLPWRSSNLSSTAMARRLARSAGVNFTFCHGRGRVDRLLLQQGSSRPSLATAGAKPAVSCYVRVQAGRLSLRQGPSRPSLATAGAKPAVSCYGRGQAGRLLLRQGPCRPSFAWAGPSRRSGHMVSLLGGGGSVELWC